MTTHAASPLIALISAVPAAIPPSVQAFDAEFPSARIWNILDDRLLQDADDVGGVTPDLEDRMRRLIRHAVAEGADGVLLTCSVYGAVAHDMASEFSIPVLAPDDAAFNALLRSGHQSVVLMSSGAGPLADSESRLAEAAVLAGRMLDIIGVVAEDAAGAAAAGDVEGLADSLYRAYTAVGDEADAILIGQYSLAPAAMRLAELTGLPVIAGPQHASSEIRRLLDVAEVGAAS